MSSAKLEPISDASHTEDVNAVLEIGHSHNCDAAMSSTGEGKDMVVTRGFETDLSALPKGYYTSRFFIGSMLATGFSLMAGVGAFGLAAPILSEINDELGPDPRYAWISLVYNVSLAVFFTPVGRLSDLFGRRWFFISGAAVAVLGSIVCATAKTIPVLIGGNVLLGVATSTQLSFHYVMGELVPMKYRYLGLALLYPFCVPLSGVGSIISFAFLDHTRIGWRGLYWVLLSCNVVNLILWSFFYFPPSFTKKHKDDDEDIRHVSYWLRHFDYVGTLLFTAGFVLFLLGLSWGGSVYPWKSAAVITSIVLGAALLAVLALWEIYAPLREPLVPIYLLADVKWVCNSTVLGLGASAYYSLAIIWPMQASIVYGATDIELGALSAIPGLGIILGQMIGGTLAPRIGRVTLQCGVVLVAGGALIACMATAGGEPSTRATAIGLLIMGTMFIGYNEAIALAGTTLLARDQHEIGVAGGLGSSIRSAISSVVSAVYVTVLSNRLAATIPAQVPSALVAAGLPASSVEAFLSAAQAGTVTAADAATALATSIPGLTQAILDTGIMAYRNANADAYKTVYLASIAFTGLAVVLALLGRNTEDMMTDQIVATLANEDNSLTQKLETGKIQ
ncbi:hypothetical protein SEUCBS140593_010722 [Sporothrix eucalyptigena]|uniref:Major facilitator superfamily (MFS) profile domain-containing protein n=1 Tax=Sporothrix eucalyptigena TaxID=1812306 RepID=A0ABP0D4P0_9PEZI